MATSDLMMIKDAVARGLWLSIKYTKGKCVYVTPTKILEISGYPFAKLPRAKAEVRNILSNLCLRGLMKYVGFRAKSHVYCITEESPLWHAIKKSDGPEDVLSFLEKVVS
ncbi:MAG: hypothetical protein L7H10_07690 [Vulcanisaeta sp.]|nr:hypothetical protein [Vulcanisaeta sp.]